MNYIITDIKEDVMRNKRILAISAIAISASVFMAACSFGGGNPDESVAVSVTPTPVATETPAPTATIAPNVQATTYTSADKSVAINLPNATWANKTDEADTLSFESPDEGKILILHGQGADTMASTVIPSTHFYRCEWHWRVHLHNQDAEHREEQRKPVCDPQGYRKRFRILQHRSIC